MVTVLALILDVGVNPTSDIDKINDGLSAAIFFLAVLASVYLILFISQYKYMIKSLLD